MLQMKLTIVEEDQYDLVKQTIASYTVSQGGVQALDSQLLQLLFRPALFEASGPPLSASLSPMAKMAVHSNDQGQSMPQAGDQYGSHGNRGCLLWIQTRPLPMPMKKVPFDSKF
jgi:hypothetical protein